MGLWVHKYTSAISGDKASLTITGETTAESLSRIQLDPGDYAYMDADEIHTIYVPKDEEAAWLVFEGKEDANYKPLVYSNHDLSNFNFDALYKKPTKDELRHLLWAIGFHPALSTPKPHPSPCNPTF